MDERFNKPDGPSKPWLAIPKGETADPSYAEPEAAAVDGLKSVPTSEPIAPIDDGLKSVPLRPWREIRAQMNSMLADEDLIVPPVIITRASGGLAATARVERDPLLSLDELTKEALAAALDRADGNHTRAAKLLGVSRATLYRMLPRYGMK